MEHGEAQANQSGQDPPSSRGVRKTPADSAASSLSEVNAPEPSRPVVDAESWKAIAAAKPDQHTVEQYREEARQIESLPIFEKLSGHYQFAINYRDDSLQNRGSHSYQVKAVAGSICRMLELPEASAALAETIAVAHDLGHPPFSHWGETAINKRLKPLGGSWNHDTAGVLALTSWASSEDSSEGVSISSETLEGVVKRYWRYDDTVEPGYHNRARASLPEVVLERDVESGGGLHLDCYNHLEGQIAYQSDRISFNATDIQDGLRVGRFTPEVLKEQFPAAYNTYRKVLSDYITDYKRQTGRIASDEKLRDIVVSNPDLHGQVFERFASAFVQHQISDLIERSDQRLSELSVSAPEEVRNLDGLLVDFSDSLKAEFRSFARYCRENVFAEHTAPFEPIFDAVFEAYLQGDLALPTPYKERLQVAPDDLAESQIIAEYMTRELHDLDVIALAQSACPEVYAENFPRYEQVNYERIGIGEAHQKITEQLLPTRRAGRYVGMPTIHASELDFRPENSVEVVSSTRKYIVPLPQEGETIQVPYAGKRKSGEQFKVGEPIFDWKNRPISGKGIVFFNADDDQ